MNKTTGLNNEILNQIAIFVSKMCFEFSLTYPLYELLKLRSHSEAKDLPSTSNSHQNNHIESKTCDYDEDEYFKLTEEEIKEDDNFKKLLKRKDFLDNLKQVSQKIQN